MILQVGLGVEAGEEVAVEVVEAVGADVDLEDVTVDAYLEGEAEPVLGPVKVLDADVGRSGIELVDEGCFLVKLRIILVAHSGYRKSLKG